MTDRLDVALCQHGLGEADTLTALFETLDQLFDRAGDADVYVLPELTFIDHLLRDDAALRELALDEASADRVHDFLRSVASQREATVVGGSYNALQGDAVVNRCPVVTLEGTVHTYDKRHLTPNEREQGKTPGRSPPPVVDHDGIGLGVVICYDVEFPETVRETVDRGAEVLAVPSWTDDAAGAERVRRCAAARAVENQSYVAQVSLVGSHPRAEFEGRGRSAMFAPCDDVVGAGGTRLSLPQNEPAAATARVDLGALRVSRERAAVRPYTDYVDE